MSIPTTTNLGLRKPGYDDKADIADINYNMDLLDTKLAGLASANIGDAAVKPVDTEIGTASTSTNLPTSGAVAAFVEGKGYLTQHQSLSGCVQTTGSQSMAGPLSITDNTDAESTSTGALKVTGGISSQKNIYGDKVFNAVWNDYAECRTSETDEPGRVIMECADGTMRLADERLLGGCKIISDTFGHCMGEGTPVAVAGRVLAYPYPKRDAEMFRLGAAVCSAPGGTVDVMTREEIKEYPERIIGTISEIPAYDVWQAGSKENPKQIPVNGRIWIYVRG